MSLRIPSSFINEAWRILTSASPPETRPVREYRTPRVRNLADTRPEILDSPPPYEEQEESPTTPTRTWEINFSFHVDPEVWKSRGTIPPEEYWSAQLVLTSWDLPSLMRDGLFLDASNIQVEDGHIKKPVYFPKVKSWCYERSYTLVDSRWSGYLSVYATERRVLAGFRIHNLSAGKVILARAEDEKSNIVYDYDASDPSLNANSIYDDMPMKGKGLWPWPEESVEEDETGEDS